jgi:hypothetical protein
MMHWTGLQRQTRGMRGTRARQQSHSCQLGLQARARAAGAEHLQQPALQPSSTISKQCMLMKPQLPATPAVLSEAGAAGTRHLQQQAVEVSRLLLSVLLRVVSVAECVGVYTGRQGWLGVLQG